MDAKTAQILLDRERNRLRQMLPALAMSGAPAGDLREPEAEADSGNRMLERELAESLESFIAGELAEVDAAMRRLERRPFGRCEVCGSRITDARLRARPAARTCTAHA